MRDAMRRGVLAVGFLVVCCVACGQQQANKPVMLSRDEVVKTIADARRIVSPNGIEQGRAIAVNGTQQWISVRGRDRRNPILLLVHGGPGSPEMPDDWTFQSPWEDYFTVVEWDQRGAGKTYSLNDPKIVAPTLTLSQMVSDTEVVIEYLRQMYGKQKIFLLGHSWGSVLGMTVAKEHPELLYAYVGVGQMIDTAKSEAEGYQWALAQARAQNNAEAVKELNAIAPYPGNLSSITFAKVDAERKWTMYYGGLAWGRRDFKWDANAWELSPDYTEAELDGIDRGSALSISHLVGPFVEANFEDVRQLGCPLFLFIGAHDYTVSHSVAEAWFRRVSAPQKELVEFPDASHMLMQEDPGRFLEHLVRDVRPIAVKAGDAAADERVLR